MTAWKATVEVSAIFHSETLTLHQKATAIRQAFHSQEKADPDDLGLILEELVDAGEADDERWFDLCWSAVYDWADANRVWVSTHAPVTA